MSDKKDAAIKKVAPKREGKPPGRSVKRISISIADQHLTGWTNDSIAFELPCVTGDAKHPTPKGKFKIIQKELVRRSRTYDAQMNYAIQLTTSGIFIHESYNYIEDPTKQNPFATLVSDTAAVSMSRMRSWFPQIGETEMKVGNVNLLGSHGCIRLAHSDAVRLFDWAETNIPVEVK